MPRLAAFCLLFAAVLRADPVEDVLARMDAAASGFHALNANVTMDTFEAILNDHTLENGTLQMQRRGDDVRAIIAFTGGNDARTLSFQKRSLRIYYPKLKSYQDFDLGNNGQLLNQFLLLGFGSSGKELAASYLITSEGTENVTGKTTTKLQLIPKDAKVKEKLSKVEIWIAESSASPVQQQFYEPSGNSRKVTYSDEVLNPPLKGSLEFKLPAGAKKQ